ncbi:MAG: methyltransferase domain-containing protein [Rhodospirillaceae bacterium]|jgi:arsenite methyltransferase|nr:methyltransferase domain-containing protein [Rhodospirillaceae bacterium]
MNTDVDIAVNPDALREQVRLKYAEVAVEPNKGHHFHTGRPLAKRLGYDQGVVDGLPDAAVESFAGVGNPFSMRDLAPGESVVDAGAGAGFDSFVAAGLVGPGGAVVGVDMTPEMLSKSRTTAAAMVAENVDFREGLLEAIPVADAWADVIISNGVFNLCADKKQVFSEVFRVLKPGGCLQFADIANGAPVPEGAMHDVDLWTA